MKNRSWTILSWTLWIFLTIASFFLAVWFWSPIISEKFGTVREPAAALWWILAVFGTWLIMLIPLIVWMYFKVDKAYEDKRLQREKAQNEFKTISIEKELRILPESLSRKLLNAEELLPNGHLAHLKLSDGQTIENAFIQNKNEIIGLYGVREMTFSINEIADIIPLEKKDLIDFQTNKWLRLDGVSSEENTTL